MEIECLMNMVLTSEKIKDKKIQTKKTTNNTGEQKGTEKQKVKRVNTTRDGPENLFSN